MRFQLLFAVALFAAIVAACIVDGTKDSDKTKKVRKNASISRDHKVKQKNGNGKLKFNDEEDVTIEVDGVKSKVHMKKTDINPAKPTRDGQEAAVYHGKTKDGDVVCREECRDESNCDMSCLVEGGDATVFVHGNKALVITGGSGETDSATSLPVPSITRRRKRASRFLRSLQSEITSAGVVKLIAFPDSEFMAVFMTLNSNNMVDATNDVEYFLTLIANEMTLHYQSLKDYGLTMTRGVGGASGPLDIAIQIVHIEFPQYDNNTQTFVNFAWSSDNVVGDNVFYNAFNTGTTSGDGMLYDFKDWIANTYTTTIAYDHATALTGYDLSKMVTYSDGTTAVSQDLAGIAWTGSLCHFYYARAGYHTSLIELTSAFSRLISHELGHGIGSQHDGTGGCDNLKNIMATSLFYESTATQDDYFKFSSCSANYINNHLSNINSDYFASTCLSDPTQIYLDSFCSGVFGSHTGVTTQCQFKHGSNSVPYPWSVHGTTGNYYVNECVRNSTTGVYALYCLSSGGSYYSMRVADGTQCVSADGSLADQVCFQGSCVSQPTIC